MRVFGATVHAHEDASAGEARNRDDVHEGDEIDEQAFTALVRAAVALNTA